MTIGTAEVSKWLDGFRAWSNANPEHRQIPWWTVPLSGTFLTGRVPFPGNRHAAREDG